MASQQANYLTNNTKRPSFFGSPSSEQVNHSVPFKHYAIIYLDEDGRLGSMSSSSIQYISTIFTSEVFQDFLTAVRKSSDFGEPVASSMDALSINPRKHLANTLLAYPSDCVTNYYPADGFDTRTSDSDYSSSCGNSAMYLPIGQTQAITNYYESALKRFQQLNCRVVARAFIKFIEPRKQTSHPYNGGKPSPGSAPGSAGDPELTKPEWWPPDVMHKEPDHLRKECMFLLIILESFRCTDLSPPDRIQLLLHIIRKLKVFGVTADELIEVAKDTRRSLEHPSHIGIILEILRVRRMEERFEDGDVGGNTLVKVVFHGPRPKGDDNEGPTDSFDVMNKGAIRQTGEDLSTPNYSIEQHATSPTSTNAMNIPAYSVPGSHSPLIFESQQGCHTYITPTQYQHLSSQSVRGTPVTAGMSGTHNSSVSDYPTPIPFPMTTPNQPSGRIINPYDITPVPSFLDNAVRYNTLPSPQSLSQSSMPGGLSMETAGRLHAVHLDGQPSEDPVGISRPFHISSGVACKICNPSR